MVHSLRLRLLLWLLLPLTAFTLLGAWESHRDAVRLARQLDDQALLASARVIAGALSWSEGRLRASAPPAALELLASPARDNVYYFVAQADGRLLAGNADFFLAAQFPASAPAWADLPFRGDLLRVAYQARTMVDASARRTVWIGVGRATRQRERMVAGLWLPQLRRQVAMLAFAAALVVAGLTIELRPLLRLSRELADKSPMELEPIRAGSLHAELRPVVEAINQCIQRLNAQVSAQRRFIADAAHQLRTPLTLLDTQLQYAARLDQAAGAEKFGQAAGAENAAGILQALRESSRNMVALTNQLLMLAQAESADSGAFLKRRADLAGIAVAVLEERAGAAHARDIDLGFDGCAEPATIDGNVELISAMIANLIDNAIKYTPVASAVTVAVSLARAHGAAAATHAVLSVTDNGPGMPAEARERAFERFFRHADAGQPGTGLGLAIVREIAERHGGSVELGPNPAGPGLRVAVRLPLAEAGA